MDFEDFTAAIQRQFGLRVAPRRMPVEVIVIERIEKPTGN